MTKTNQIWKCEICGNIIEILHEGQDSLVCCNQPMKLISEKNQGEYAEKHSPVIDNKTIKIGKIEHPMEQEHYIEWIEAKSEDEKICKKFLKPGIKPQAEFSFAPTSARMYCNIHGLWTNKE